MQMSASILILPQLVRLCKKHHILPQLQTCKNKIVAVASQLISDVSNHTAIKIILTLLLISDFPFLDPKD